MKQYLFLFLLLILSSNFCSSQVEHHIATNGNNTSGNGTIGNPYATLEFAINKALPGDFVLVHAGTYRNREFNDGNIWEGDNLVKMYNINGTASNYITIKPYANNKVILEFDADYGVLIQNCSYLIFEGFEVKGISDNITQTEADDAWGLYIDNSDGLIYNLEDEIGINYPDPSPYVRGDDIPKTPKNLNKPTYFSGKGIVANKSHHIIIRNNSVHDTPGSGIRSQQSDYITISNNEVL
jgi:parallel beta-helix repeat protein